MNILGLRNRSPICRAKSSATAGSTLLGFWEELGFGNCKLCLESDESTSKKICKSRERYLKQVQPRHDKKIYAGDAASLFTITLPPYCCSPFLSISWRQSASCTTALVQYARTTMTYKTTANFLVSKILSVLFFIPLRLSSPR